MSTTSRPAGAATAMLLAAGGARADTGPAGFEHHAMSGWGGWIYGPLMMLVFFGLLVAAAVLIVRLLGGGTPGSPPAEDRSRAILRERFARGEIDAEEFERARRVLD